MFRLSAFVLLIIAASPVLVVVLVLMAVSGILNIRQARGSGVSLTAAGILSRRSMLDRAGTRPDAVARELFRRFPFGSPTLSTLYVAPIFFASRVTGYQPALMRCERGGSATTQSMLNARTAFFDAALDRHRPQMRQLVVLGAGFDTRAFTHAEGLRVFEVDTPETQALKQRLLAEAGRPPDNVTFVALDFTETSWLATLETADIGFPVDGLAFVETDAGLAGYTDDDAAALYETWRARVAALPGVESATLAVGPPTGELDGPFSSSELDIGGYVRGEDEFTSEQWTWAGPRYFETLGLLPLYGRTFTQFDRPETPSVTVISDRLARLYFGTPNAVGRRFRMVDRTGATDGVGLEVIGVVPDTRSWVPREPLPTFCRPSSQAEASTPTVVARTTLDPIKLLPLMRQTLRDLGAELPVLRSRTMRQHIAAALDQPRAAGAFLGGLGTLGMGLASLGLYAVIAFGVSQQAREIGIRRALGADRTHVIWTVSRHVAALVGVGLAVGLGLAWVSMRGVAAMATSLTLVVPPPGLMTLGGGDGAAGRRRTGGGVLPRTACRPRRSAGGAARAVRPRSSNQAKAMTISRMGSFKDRWLVLISRQRISD